MLSWQCLMFLVVGACHVAGMLVCKLEFPTLAGHTAGTSQAAGRRIKSPARCVTHRAGDLLYCCRMRGAAGYCSLNLPPHASWLCACIASASGTFGRARSLL